LTDLPGVPKPADGRQYVLVFELEDGNFATTTEFEYTEAERERWARGVKKTPKGEYAWKFARYEVTMPSRRVLGFLYLGRRPLGGQRPFDRCDRSSDVRG